MIFPKPLRLIVCCDKPGENLKQTKTFMLRWKRHLYDSSFPKNLGITLRYFQYLSFFSGFPWNFGCPAPLSASLFSRKI